MAYTPMELAEAFIKTGELSDALDALNQHLAQSPTDDTAKRLRASVLLRVGNTEQLATAVEDLQQLSNTNADDRVQLSILYEHIGQLDNAIAEMKNALTISPSDDRMIERLLNLYVAQNTYEAALELVQQQAQDWRWLQWEADLRVKSGDDEAAIHCYETLIAQLEEHFDLDVENYLRVIKGQNLLACAHAYHRLSQYQRAQEYYLAAQVILPDDPTINFHFGINQALQGNLTKATQLCQSALDNSSRLLRQELMDHLQAYASLANLYRELLSNTSWKQ